MASLLCPPCAGAPRIASGDHRTQALPFAPGDERAPDAVRSGRCEPPRWKLVRSRTARARRHRPDPRAHSRRLRPGLRRPAQRRSRARGSHRATVRSLVRPAVAPRHLAARGARRPRPHLRSASCSSGWGATSSAPGVPGDFLAVYLGLRRGGACRPGDRLSWPAVAEPVRPAHVRRWAMLDALIMRGRLIFPRATDPVLLRPAARRPQPRLSLTLAATVLFALFSRLARLLPHFAADRVHAGASRATRRSGSWAGCGCGCECCAARRPRIARLVAGRPAAGRATRPLATTDAVRPSCAPRRSRCPRARASRPSSTATSKSWLMPIDSSEPSSSASAAPRSRSSRSRRKRARAARDRPSKGGRIIRPVDAERLEARAGSRGPGRGASRRAPCLVSSPARSTCTSTGHRPALGGVLLEL